MKSFHKLLGALALITSLMNAAHAQAQAHAHAHDIQAIEPASWWIGMHSPALQLLIHGQRIAELKPQLAPYPGVRLQRVAAAESPNYLFVDLQIDADAKPGNIELRFESADGRIVLTQPYPLRERQPGSAQRRGFGPQDAIYLIVPDRFAQGEPGRTPSAAAGKSAPLLEGIDRAAPGGRHGGDLSGMRQHLDYVAGMGFTQIWPTPLTENNATSYSYHGYASTDFYRVDPRFGSNEDYLDFVAEAKARGIGVIQDIVLNHIGANHGWMRDPPSRDWINQWPVYTETHHARMTLQDPYAAPSDRRRFSDGWFSPNMPDLNQRNPLLARYLTQMSIWWIEHAGLSGLRTDTYSYSDKAFLATWSARLLQEYPRFNIVGEEWSPHPAVVAYWQRGKSNHDGYVSSMPSMMDFPLHGALLAGLAENDSVDGGLSKLYEALAHDFLYPDPARLVLFEGNHDTPRLFTALNEDLGLYKMALAYLATTRRIPQFFYGSEVLLQSPKLRDDGAVRADFPGGWAGDAVNAFTGQGLSAQQKDAQDFMRRLLNWRKTSKAVHEGTLMHYAPEQGIYCLFRSAAGAPRVLLVLNKNRQDQPLDLRRFAEMLSTAAGTQATEVISGKTYRLGDQLLVPARSALILEFIPTE